MRKLGHLKLFTNKKQKIKSPKPKRKKRRISYNKNKNKHKKLFKSKDKKGKRVITFADVNQNPSIQDAQYTDKNMKPRYDDDPSEKMKQTPRFLKLRHKSTSNRVSRPTSTAGYYRARYYRAKRPSTCLGMKKIDIQDRQLMNFISSTHDGNGRFEYP